MTGPATQKLLPSDLDSARLLWRRGYFVRATRSIQSALEMAAKERFDVLVSDIGLPDGSGIDLIQSLNAERPILSIALTGFGMEAAPQPQRPEVVTDQSP